MASFIEHKYSYKDIFPSLSVSVNSINESTSFSVGFFSTPISAKVSCTNFATWSLVIYP